ncbi:MAG: preprotein translocase subunit SecG [Bradyrhizobiaceae bacterium]|nr:preprotein translocase subunit SecG [Bradyrhizobiaceae bacterium]
MATFLILISVFASILLILVVLIQPGKSEMISGMGGLGGQINNMLGVRTGRNLLQNITIGLLVALAVLAIVVNRVFLSTDVEQKGPVTVGRELPTQSAPTPAAPAPQPAQPAQQPAQQGQ